MELVQFVGKFNGAMRAALIFVLKNKSVKKIGWKHYIGKMSSLRTEERGTISIGNKLYLSDRCVVGAYKGGKLIIGDNNFFNNNCSVTCYEEIFIGNNNLFAQNIVIVDHNHLYENQEIPICKQGYKTKKVSIGSNCWICTNTVICAGACIGDNIVVSANSVVKGSLIESGIYAGSPARLVKKFGDF